MQRLLLGKVRKIIKRLKNKKSFGVDNIPNIVLKQLPNEGIELLTSIANAANGIIQFSYFPEEWKCAHVVPIPKPSKPLNNVKSMRPISLLCNMSKIIERIMYARISELAEMRNILPEFQFGFRKKLSTIHALMNLTEKVIAGFCDFF